MSVPKQTAQSEAYHQKSKKTISDVKFRFMLSLLRSANFEGSFVTMNIILNSCQGTPPFNPNGSPSLLGNLPFPNPLLSPRHSGSPSHDSSTNHRETVSFGPPVPAEEQNFLNDFPVHGSSMPQNCSSSNAVLPPSSDFSNLLRNPAFNQPRLDNVSSIMQFLKDGYNTSAALDLQRHRDQTSLNLAGIIPQAPPGGTIDIIDSD